MKVSFLENSQVLVEMTADELGILRYALDAGTKKLETTASYLRHLNSSEAASASATADCARACNGAIETATQEAIRRND